MAGGLARTGGGNAVGVTGGAGTRASDRERDAVVQRVQDAFAEGRLDDAEFGTVEIGTRPPDRPALRR